MNIDYCKTKTGSFTLWLAPSFMDSSLRDALAEGLHSLETEYTLDKVPASKSADVYIFSCDSGRFYFKLYNYRSLWDIIKHTVRPSRAARTMKAAAMLEANGFAVPEIIAMGCRRKGIFHFENFLLTCEIENALPLYLFFDRHYGRFSKKEFLIAFGRLVGRLHEKNISHGDLRLGNVLVRKNDHGWSFFLLDNERTVQYCRLPDRLRLKNLVQCNMHLSKNLTRTDRLRFFKAYVSENPAIKSQWKQWVMRVHKKTSGRLAKRSQ